MTRCTDIVGRCLRCSRVVPRATHVDLAAGIESKIADLRAGKAAVQIERTSLSQDSAGIVPRATQGDGATRRGSESSRVVPCTAQRNRAACCCRKGARIGERAGGQ